MVSATISTSFCASKSGVPDQPPDLRISSLFDHSGLPQRSSLCVPTSPRSTARLQPNYVHRLGPGEPANATSTLTGLSERFASLSDSILPHLSDETVKWIGAKALREVRRP